MIQDIAPHQFHVEYTPVPVTLSAPVLVFTSREVYMKNDTEFFTYEDLKDLFPVEAFRFLFLIDEQAWFLLDHPDLSDEDMKARLPRSKSNTLRYVRTLQPMARSFAAYTGWHLFNWYRSNRFCGKCGTPTEPGTDERKLVCPHCGNSIYPRINPCVIVAVHDKDRLLMTKYAGRAVTWFVLIAGFMEIGESAEDTVRREVLEETGVHIKNIRYFGSQPWGIPGNLTLGYTAELDGDDAITLDKSELAEGRWFDRGDVPVPDDSLSITAAMIRAFSEGKF